MTVTIIGSTKTEMDVILSYYAGFVDGEGYIGIKKYIRKDKGSEKFSPSYSERVSIGGINELSIKAFNDLVIGNIHYKKPSKLNERGFWNWEVSENKARIFLKMILPYLKIKRLDAELVLALGKNKLKNKSKPVSKEDNELRESLYILLKKVHHYSYE
ncbi:MAG: hypothetical protein UT62_C0008G0020 [Parcubacteria group bacterium GW2011_GWC1_39_8]|nr:MAG: hypothetical protein UT62_C0008G0020 [Parcubacteria group bacterium GW2011_GWC1_39_8]